jgi:membrane-associated phospholipid phosphatase
MHTSPPRLHRFLAARLAPGTAFGLHLSLGLFAAVLAAAVFGRLAADVVSHASITAFDQWLATWLHGHATPSLVRATLVFTHLHGNLGIALLTAFLVYAMWRSGARAWAMTAALAVPGGMLLNVLLKSVFQRVRPAFDDPLLTLSTYSFPSGHTVNATLFYGVLAAWLFTRSRGPLPHALIIVMACIMATLVGLSRMVLGVHYFSDVVAGMAEGCFWLALCLTTVSTFRRHRAAIAGRSR